MMVLIMREESVSVSARERVSVSVTVIGSKSSTARIKEVKDGEKESTGRGEEESDGVKHITYKRCCQLYRQLYFLHIK
jgi:phage-related protein